MLNYMKRTADELWSVYNLFFAIQMTWLNNLYLTHCSCLTCPLQCLHHIQQLPWMLV